MRVTPRPPRVLGNDVVTYTFVTTPNEPDINAWLMVSFAKVAAIRYTGIPPGDEEHRVSFDQLIRRKGRREMYLRGIAIDRGLIKPPTDDTLGFLRWHEKRKKRTPSRNGR